MNILFIKFYMEDWLSLVQHFVTNETFERFAGSNPASS